MKLTNAQLGALREQQHAQFVDEMARFFTQTDPFHAQALGPDGLRTALIFGIRHARADGISQRDPVRVYLQLMFFLGGRFAKDPLLPWTRPILDPQTAFRSQADRMAQLRSAAIDHLRQTCGADGAPLRAFLRACCTLSEDTEKVQRAAARCAAFLKETYPLKYAAIGEATVARLIADGDARCANAGLVEPASAFYLTCLRFVYGFWMMDDPLFPWLGKLFEDGSGKPGRDRVLERLVLSFLGNVRAHIDQREQAHVG